MQIETLKNSELLDNYSVKNITLLINKIDFMERLSHHVKLFTVGIKQNWSVENIIKYNIFLYNRKVL